MSCPHCGKVDYLSRTAAKRAAKAIARESGVKLYVYACSGNAGVWHVTRLARAEHLRRSGVPSMGGRLWAALLAVVLFALLPFRPAAAGVAGSRGVGADVRPAPATHLQSAPVDRGPAGSSGVAADVPPALKLSWLVLSDLTFEARAAVTSGPLTVRARGSTGAGLGTFAGAGLVLDGRPAGALQAQASVDVWWVNPRWRGECRLDVGAIFERECVGGYVGNVRVYATLATLPSAQLWESTSGGSSRADDFGYVLAAGVSVDTREHDRATGIYVRFAARLEVGVQTDARVAQTVLHVRGALVAAFELDAHAALVVGVEADAIGGPRATPLDWRTLAAVGRVVLGVELRFGGR